MYHEYERKKYLNKLNFTESLHYTNNLAIRIKKLYFLMK